MLVMRKGAGDIASGIALRLWRAGINVVMTDLPKPSSIRRTVCFSEAVYRGETKVEEVRARLAADAADALRLLEENILPVIVDPKAESAKELHPDVIVDAILAKENLGTAITDAPASSASARLHRRDGLPRRCGDDARPHARPRDLVGQRCPQHRRSPATSAAIRSSA